MLTVLRETATRCASSRVGGTRVPAPEAAFEDCVADLIVDLAGQILSALEMNMKVHPASDLGPINSVKCGSFAGPCEGASSDHQRRRL
jgi:hypothetical protein